MPKNATLHLVIPDDLTDPNEVREAMIAAVHGMGDDEFEEYMKSEPKTPGFVHVHAIPNDEGKAPAEAISVDGERMPLEEFRELSAVEREPFVHSVQQAAAAKSSAWAYWVREDLIEDDPVLALVTSSDGSLTKNVDLRPCLLEARSKKLAEAINNGFSDAEDKRAILTKLEQEYDPTADKMSHEVGTDFELEIDADVVREWVMRERPQVGYALINAPGPK